MAILVNLVGGDVGLVTACSGICKRTRVLRSKSEHQRMGAAGDEPVRVQFVTDVGDFWFIWR